MAGKKLSLKGIKLGSESSPVEDEYTRLMCPFGDYDIYLNEKNGEIIFWANEYHPRTLIFTKEGLAALLESLESIYSH